MIFQLLHSWISIKFVMIYIGSQVYNSYINQIMSATTDAKPVIKATDMDPEELHKVV